MIKTLTKHGNSLALVIDRPILDLLKIDATTPLEVTTDGRSLVIAPRRQASDQEALARALEEVNAEFGDVLERLAK